MAKKNKVIGQVPEDLTYQLLAQQWQIWESKCLPFLDAQQSDIVRNQSI